MSLSNLNLRSLADDIDNQVALRLARREDPEGKRTIGSPYFWVSLFALLITGLTSQEC